MCGYENTLFSHKKGFKIVQKNYKFQVIYNPNKSAVELFYISTFFDSLISLSSPSLAEVLLSWAHFHELSSSFLLFMNAASSQALPPTSRRSLST